MNATHKKRCSSVTKIGKRLKWGCDCGAEEIPSSGPLLRTDQCCATCAWWDRDNTETGRAVGIKTKALFANCTWNQKAPLPQWLKLHQIGERETYDDYGTLCQCYIKRPLPE